jgi:hypothetical protein
MLIMYDCIQQVIIKVLTFQFFYGGNHENLSKLVK